MILDMGMGNAQWMGKIRKMTNNWTWNYCQYSIILYVPLDS